MAGHGRNKFVRKNDIVGNGQKNSSSIGGNSVDTSTGGASGGSAATSSQAGSQGTSGSDKLLAMVTSSQADKGKKEKCFRCNLPADHVGTDCFVELCIYCDSALH
jgi:hypothetical protein